MQTKREPSGCVWVAAFSAHLIETKKTHNKAQLLVVAGVHGLAFLHAAAVVGLTLHVEGDPAQLEDDVPLSLHVHRGMLKSGRQISLYFHSFLRLFFFFF